MGKKKENSTATKKKGKKAKGKVNDRPQKTAKDTSTQKPVVGTFLKPELDLYLDLDSPPKKRTTSRRFESRCACDRVCRCNKVALCACNRVTIGQGAKRQSLCRCEQVMRCGCDLVRTCACDGVYKCRCVGHRSPRRRGGGGGYRVCTCVPVIH